MSDVTVSLRKSLRKMTCPARIRLCLRQGRRILHLWRTHSLREDANRSLYARLAIVMTIAIGETETSSADQAPSPGPFAGRLRTPNSAWNLLLPIINRSPQLTDEALAMRGSVRPQRCLAAPELCPRFAVVWRGARSHRHIISRNLWGRRRSHRQTASPSFQALAGAPGLPLPRGWHGTAHRRHGASPSVVEIC